MPTKRDRIFYGNIKKKGKLKKEWYDSYESCGKEISLARARGERSHLGMMPANMIALLVNQTMRRKFCRQFIMDNGH